MHVKLLYQTVILYFFPSEAFNVALSILSRCLKSSHIRSFSGPYFPTFGLNTEIYSVNREYCGYGHLPHSFYTILSILFLYVIWYNKISLSQQYNAKSFHHTVLKFLDFTQKRIQNLSKRLRGAFFKLQNSLSQMFERVLNTILFTSLNLS